VAVTFESISSSLTAQDSQLLDQAVGQLALLTEQVNKIPPTDVASIQAYGPALVAAQTKISQIKADLTQKYSQAQTLSVSSNDSSTAKTRTAYDAAKDTNNDGQVTPTAPTGKNFLSTFPGGYIQITTPRESQAVFVAFNEDGTLLGSGTTLVSLTESMAKGPATADNLTAVTDWYNKTGRYYVEDPLGDPPTMIDTEQADAIKRVQNFEAELPPNSVNKTGEDAKDSKKLRTQPVGGNIPVTMVSSVNPLSECANSTYGLAIHVLPPSQYVELINNPGSNFKPQITLVASAGRYAATPPRDSAFTDDFYFQNLKMTTVIGLNSASRGSNSLDVQFTLVEPYGLTFLNRLLDLSARLGLPNYLDVPYLLEITFFGSDDSGKYSKLDSQTKLIPIRIISLKLKAGTQGSEYQISAVPYSNMTQMQSLAVTKANFSITSRTVGEFFKSRASDINNVQAQVNASAISTSMANDHNAAAKEYQGRLNSTGVNNLANLYDEGAITQEQLINGTQMLVGDAQRINGKNATQVVPVTTATITGSSFTDIWNLWQTDQQIFGYQDEYDEISFDIDSDILNAEIVEPKTAAPSNSTMYGKGTNSQQDNSRDSGPKSVGVDFTKSFFNIGAGTSIMSVINNMVINSSYIRNQLADSDSSTVDSALGAGTAGIAKAKNASAVDWFKVTTKIELKNFDHKRNVYAKKITYFIRKYTHYEPSFPGAPKGQPTGSVKDYQYFYTGKNTDVIDFSIEFNGLFATLVQTNNNNTGQLLDGTNPSGKTGAADQPQYQITPSQQNYISTSPSYIVGGNSFDPKSQQAKNFADNIYQNAGGDMLSLQLKILGDPQFIKQDEILFSSDKISNSSSQFVNGSDGSIRMDNGEVFCNVTFKTPVDINEETGLLRKDPVWADCYFSGLYRVMTVVNDFSKGIFTQSLSLIRHRNQTGDSKRQADSTGVTKRVDKTSPDSNDASNTALNGGQFNPYVCANDPLTNPESQVNGGRPGTPPYAEKPPAVTWERYDFRQQQQDARMTAIMQAKNKGLSDSEAENLGAIAGNNAGTAAFVTLSKNTTPFGSPVIGNKN
jgi:hypothetical protein